MNKKSPIRSYQLVFAVALSLTHWVHASNEGGGTSGGGKGSMGEECLKQILMMEPTPSALSLNTFCGFNYKLSTCVAQSLVDSGHSDIQFILQNCNRLDP